MTEIRHVHARQVLDSRGNPTVEVEVELFDERLKVNFGGYVQDQWTLQRLTLNAGVRFDWLRSRVAAIDNPAAQLRGQVTVEELLARLRAAQRRSGAPVTDHVVATPDFTVDLGTCNVPLPVGKTCKLNVTIVPALPIGPKVATLTGRMRCFARSHACHQKPCVA